MYHIIINPVAGQGRGHLLLPMLTDHLRAHGKRYTEMVTKSPMDARAMAKYACAVGSEGIIGVGGDGTMQEIVTGMSEATPNATVIPTPLGILPNGSGNDFMLTLTKTHYQRKKPPAEAGAFIHNLLANRTQPSDLIRADGMVCLNIANIGLDAMIVRNATSLKKLFRRNAYLVSAFKTILQYPCMPLRVEVNGEVITGPFLLLALCNGQYYGGGMRIAPAASINDGKLELCLIEGMPRLKTLALFPSVLIEKHICFKEVRFITCMRLTVTLPGSADLCMDGNLFQRSGALCFEVMPGALKLFQPF